MRFFSKISIFTPPGGSRKAPPNSLKFCTPHFLMGVPLFVTSHLNFEKKSKKRPTLVVNIVARKRLHASSGVARGSAARGGSKNCHPKMSNSSLSINQLQMRSSILHDKISKSNLYYTRWNTLKRKRDGGPISATLRLGIGQHSKMIYD